MTSPAPRKSRQVLFGILVMAAGLIGAVVFGLIRTYGSVSSIQRFQAPSTKELALKAGPHTVYWETSLFEGVVQPELEFVLRSKAAGEEVTFQPVPFGDSYSIGNRSGVAVRTFTAPKAGDYVFTASYPPGREGKAVTLGVRAGSGWKDLILTTLGSFGILAIGAAVGIAMLISGARRAPEGGEAHA